MPCMGAARGGGGKGDYTYYIETDGTNITVYNKLGSIVHGPGLNASVEIQWAINNLPAAGGKIFIYGGTYNITITILITARNNVVLVGEGWRTTRLVAVGNTTLIKIGDRVNAALACQDIIIRGFFIDGTAQATQVIAPEINDSCFGIELCSPAAETYKILITENYIYNTGNDGIYGYIVGNHFIMNNIVEGVRGYWAGIHSHSGAGSNINLATIIGNHIFNCNCSGIRHGRMLEGNHIESCGMAGVTDGREAAIVGSMNAIILGNSICQDAVVRYGIKTFDVGNIVLGNLVKCYFLTPIYVDGYNGHIIKANRIWSTEANEAILLYRTSASVIGNSIYLATHHGINLSGSQRCIISDNILQNIGVNANNTWDAIILQVSGVINCLRNIITHNQIFTDAVNAPRYGINENDVNQDRNIIANNIVTGAVTAQIRIQGPNSVNDNNIIA